MLLLSACVYSSAGLQAQQTASIALPDAPSALAAAAPPESVAESSSVGVGLNTSPDAQSGQAGQQQEAPPQSGHTDKQTKRILGVIPNFKSVSADEKLPPMTVKSKFLEATQDSFDYSSILLPAAIAGESQARNATPEFHQGAAGYARYFWHSFVDQTQENYWVEFIIPAIAHQDPRYYTLGHGSFARRAGYSLSRVVVTRSDSSKEVFNASEILGAGIAGGISNLYYPSKERSVGNTLSQWGLNLAIDGLSLTLREFWPDINHSLFHGKE